MATIINTSMSRYQDGLTLKPAPLHTTPPAVIGTDDQTSPSMPSNTGKPATTLLSRNREAAAATAATAGSCDLPSQGVETRSMMMVSDMGPDVPTLGGHTTATEWGLHFDGDHDFATLSTTDYGVDTTWTFSLWFSKAECNPRALGQSGWEYMIAHTVAEDSDINLAGRGSPGGDDNVHIYMQCRPQMASETFWRFKSFANPDSLGPPSNMIRTVMQDSMGGCELSGGGGGSGGGGSSGWCCVCASSPLLLRVDSLQQWVLHSWCCPSVGLTWPPLVQPPPPPQGRWPTFRCP